MSTWRNAFFEGNFSFEQVLKEDLPILMGRSAHLDKKIGQILQSVPEPKQNQSKEEEIAQILWPKEETYWIKEGSLNDILYGYQLVGLTLPTKYHKACTLEVEVEGLSSGYYYSGSFHAPPEGDDERVLTQVIATFYDGDQIGDSLTITDKEGLSDYDTLIGDAVLELDIDIMD